MYPEKVSRFWWKIKKNLLAADILCSGHLAAADIFTWNDKVLEIDSHEKNPKYLRKTADLLTANNVGLSHRTVSTEDDCKLWEHEMTGKNFPKPWILQIYTKFQNYPHVYMVFLNVHKMFGRGPGHLMNVLGTFSLRPVFRGIGLLK